MTSHLILLQCSASLLAGLALSGCALASPGTLLLPLGADPAAQASRVAEQARRAEVIYLGEVHDNPYQHARQRDALEAMLADGARPALAFEMLPQEQQPALDAALAAASTAAEFDQRLGWTRRGWPDFAMYWPLFELAKRYGLRVVATDLDPALVRRIARGETTPAERGPSVASLLPPDAAREAAIARTIQKGHCDLLPERQLPSMVESWHARNVTMARRIADTLRGSSQVVMIIGRGHQAAGGLPSQLAALRAGTRQLVVDMREAGEDEAPVVESGTALIAWVTPRADRPDQCEELRRQLKKR